MAMEEEELICIFDRKSPSDLWKNIKIKKGLTVKPAIHYLQTTTEHERNDETKTYSE